MKTWVLFITLLLVAASCTKNSTEVNDRVATLSINPTLSLESTKALLDDGSINAEHIGIQIANSDGDALYDGQSENNNVDLSYSGTWNLSSAVYLSTSLAKIYAYSPFSSAEGDFTGVGAASARLLNIPASQTMANQVDYLWASQGKTVSAGSLDINSMNPAVQLKMNHALAQISFVIYKSNYFGSGVLSTIKIEDVFGSSKLKINKSSENDLKIGLATGAISGGENSTSLTVTDIGNTISLTSDPGTIASELKSKVNAWALVVPTTFASKSDVTFTFTIDGKNYVVSLGAGELSWITSNQYIYKVKLSGTTMTISSVTVAPWISSYGEEVVIQ